MYCTSLPRCWPRSLPGGQPRVSCQLNRWPTQAQIMALQDGCRFCICSQLSTADSLYYNISSWIWELFADLSQRCVKEQQPIYIWRKDWRKKKWILYVNKTLAPRTFETWLLDTKFEVVWTNQRKHEIAYVACFLFVSNLFTSKSWIGRTCKVNLPQLCSLADR